MKRVYIVKVVAGDFEDRIEKNIEGYFEKSAAESKCKELNKQYDCIVDLDLYCQGEIYITNDLTNIMSVKGESFIDFTEAILEQLEGDSEYPEIIDAWRYIEQEYNNSKYNNFKDYFDTISKDKNNYSFFFACMLKVYCQSLNRYSVEELQRAVDIYQTTWTKPYAFIEELIVIE